ncbi:MAG: family 43 glycosylhydrolase, partial [Planctomycetaceae bacterium]|nr:family 43 glycosylhydrolase [Planctomycetaceae bacterium]
SSFDEENEYRGKMLWGSDVHYYNGKYLLCGAYEWFGEIIGNTPFIVESDNPSGKFSNFRWVTGNKSNKRIDGITFKVFVEKDGTRYAIWAPTALPAEKNHLMVAKLADDNVIDEDCMKNLGNLHDFYEGPSIRKRGDTYYLIYDENCGRITKDNHTPKRLSYATSKDITGDYVYRGVILTIEDLPGNSNIQGSIEEFHGQWYVFYHRAPNAQWNRRALCVEKISFDRDGLIIPVEPSSSGIAEGLNTSKPIYFNTSVIQKNCKFSGKVGKYGGAIVKDSAEIGFRYVSLTGREKKISLQGEGLENISKVTVTANGTIIGQGVGGEDIQLENVEEGKAELVFNITSNGEAKLETLRFF